MTKVAIFVEGHTELIFVREFLLQFYEFTVSVECRTLFSSGKMNPAAYDCLIKNAEHFYQIINVGSDDMVLTRILAQETFLWNTGYHKIIGLRDMFSKNYRKKAVNRKIDAELNKKFISGTQKTIEDRAIAPEKIKFCFSIMEVETWLLGMAGLFCKCHPKLSDAFIEKNLNVNLAEINPETTIFHPAVFIDNIFQLIGEKYTKRVGDTEKIIGKITSSCFQNLLDANKCDSFNYFVEAIESNQ